MPAVPAAHPDDGFVNSLNGLGYTLVIEVGNQSIAIPLIRGRDALMFGFFYKDRPRPALPHISRDSLQDSPVIILPQLKHDCDPLLVFVVHWNILLMLS